MPKGVYHEPDFPLRFPGKDRRLFAVTASERRLSLVRFIRCAAYFAIDNPIAFSRFLERLPKNEHNAPEPYGEYRGETGEM